MTEIEIRNVLITSLKKIAPETEPGTLNPNDSIREKLGLDSFDFLQFIIAVSEALKINIPEDDYGRVSTLHDLEEYLSHHSTSKP